MLDQFQLIYIIISSTIGLASSYIVFKTARKNKKEIEEQDKNII